MELSPYVIESRTGKQIPVTIEPAMCSDLEATRGDPKWQTDWASDYLADPAIERFAVRSQKQELIALGAYQIREKRAYVYIIYVESAPHSNPTIKPRGERKYYGIGALLLAFGIKYSIDHGCRGDVVFEAKTDALARHYEADFHAIRIPSENPGGPKRYLLADEYAWDMFSQFLKEGTE